MLFRDMLSKPGHGIKDRDVFCDQFFFFVQVVMESEKVAIIRINARDGDDWSAEIVVDIFEYLERITFIGHMVK